MTLDAYLQTALDAAQAAGGFLRANFGKPLHVDENLAHDIKLELDKRTQALIESIILDRHPDHAIYGEEGLRGDQSAEHQWIIDPIDGTVNFFYNIPHFAVSIALRKAGQILIGVIYDPMMDELWQVAEDVPAMLNGKPIKVSTRAKMAEAVVTVGFSKTKESLDAGFLRYQKIAYEVRKTRMLGSAALAMAYIACGRLDAYVEEQISLWDIAAGQMLIESAGGKVLLRPGKGKQGTMFICASNAQIPIEDYL
jgi:myo-inositol-1(or 4)-monophosphatase